MCCINVIQNLPPLFDIEIHPMTEVQAISNLLNKRSLACIDIDRYNAYVAFSDYKSVRDSIRPKTFRTNKLDIAARDICIRNERTRSFIISNNIDKLLAVSHKDSIIVMVYQ